MARRARSLAGISFAFMTVLVSGASMFAMAKILHLLLGWDMYLSIWVSSLTVAVYVTLGGLGLGRVQRSAAVLSDLVRLAADAHPGAYPAPAAGRI